MRVFVHVTQRSSFAAAAVDLGMSPAFITKRVKALESAVGAKLLIRTTRRVTVTEDGERTYLWAQKILDDVDHLFDDISAKRKAPRGTLRISSSFGFGRNIVAPAISALAQRYPALMIRFEVFDRLVDVGAEGFDLDIRIGDEIAPHHIARKLAPNYRVLCASDAYLKRAGMPRSLADLPNHDCLIIKERDHPFGVWRLRGPAGDESVKVRGQLSTNHGEIAVQWAVEGRGILLRSMWDVKPLLDSGQLRQILPGYAQEANVWAVYPERLEASAKIKVCIEWLQRHLPADRLHELPNPSRKPRR
nr:LysR substrate-binding domain-containing protein [Cupriavidus sp. LEh25]